MESASVLLSFRAGIANLIDGIITPDPRRGLLRVVSSGGLLHIHWLERSAEGPTEPPEIDTVIFPEEADFVKVDQPGARIVQLRYNDSTREDLFFWMQEPNVRQDTEYCQLMQQTINMGDDGTSESEAADPGGAVAGAEAAGGGEEASSGAGGVQAADLARVLASIVVPPGNPPPAATSAQAETASGAISPELLAGILARMADQVGQPQRQLPSLAEVLTPQNLVPLLDDESVQRRLGELVEHLPLEHQSTAANQAPAATIEALRSAPLQNQIRTLSHALASGQIDFSQLGLEPLGYSAADFLQSIQNQADQQKHKEEKK